MNGVIFSINIARLQFYAVKKVKNERQREKNYFNFLSHLMASISHHSLMENTVLCVSIETASVRLMKLIFFIIYFSTSEIKEWVRERKAHAKWNKCAVMKLVIFLLLWLENKNKEERKTWNEMKCYEWELCNSHNAHTKVKEYYIFFIFVPRNNETNERTYIKKENCRMFRVEGKRNVHWLTYTQGAIWRHKLWFKSRGKSAYRNGRRVDNNNNNNSNINSNNMLEWIERVSTGKPHEIL